VFLPSAAPQDAQQEAVAPAPVTSLGRGENILLVEDEPELREFVSDILRTHHYSVIEAASGPHALEAWDQCNGAVDLLLTDMVMPDGLSGRDLAQQFRARKPELKVIYSSGYSPEIMGGECDPREALFLAKPYHPKALLQLLRQCLHSPAPARPTGSPAISREESALVPA
jgi:CheY-like chemotaxis protein